MGIPIDKPFPKGEEHLAGWVAKPENDEAQWDASIHQGGHYAKGVQDGWAKAIECLKILELTDAAERLELMAKMPHG
jgi:hypothetical protein